MKYLLASLVIVLSANAALAGNCSQNTYDYREKLIAKDSAKILQKAVIAIQETTEDIISLNTNSKVAYVLYAYGSMLGLASDLQEVKTQGFWLQNRIEVLKESCSNLYSESSLETAIKGEIKKILLPQGAKVTIDVNLKK